MLNRLLLICVVCSYLLITDWPALAQQREKSFAIEKKGNCKINTNTATLNFGSLDPGKSVDVKSSTIIRFWCTNGARYTIKTDYGLYSQGRNTPRLKHEQKNEYIPYNLNYSPRSGTGRGPSVPLQLTIQGSIVFNNYQNAFEGSYSDYLTFTILP